MKTRFDFVSNSSSCSYTLACNKKYLDDIMKDIVNSCGKSKEFKKSNRRILDFCLNTYQLVFLGELVIETKKITYNLNYFKKHIKDFKSRKSFDNFAEQLWNDYKKDLIESKKENALPYLKKRYANDIYDEVKDEAIHFENITTGNIITTNDNMEYCFNRYHYGNDDSPENKKNRVKAIIENAKNMIKYDQIKHSYCNTMGNPGIYMITQDTINNTKDLVEAGYKIIFNEWEDIESLERRLQLGDAIFCIDIATSGGGAGCYNLYCENDDYGITDVSGIEFLNSECG